MKNKNIVLIGGGSGRFSLLRGLKNHPINMTIIISMTDSAGSSGVLRKELGVLPPGDIRQCLLALSCAPELSDLLNYRFKQGTLKGHNFGNLLLAALEKTNQDFSESMKKVAGILNIKKGEIIAVSDKNADIVVELKNGKILKEEDEIYHSTEIEKAGIKKMYLSPLVKANKMVIQRILKADMIVIGPGHLYCSIAPTFLAKGVAEAIRKSRAKVILNCNLFGKKGQTEKFDADDYAEKINELIGKERIDYVIFNTGQTRKSDKIEKSDLFPVKFNVKKNPHKKYQVVCANILDRQKTKFCKTDVLAPQRSPLRHDGKKLAKILMKILSLRK